jgi:hypothetical protein
VGIKSVKFQQILVKFTKFVNPADGSGVDTHANSVPVRDTDTVTPSPPIMSSGPTDASASVSAPTNVPGGSTSSPAPVISSGAVVPPVRFSVPLFASRQDLH